MGNWWLPSLEPSIATFPWLAGLVSLIENTEWFFTIYSKLYINLLNFYHWFPITWEAPRLASHSLHSRHTVSMESRNLVKWASFCLLRLLLLFFFGALEVEQCYSERWLGMLLRKKLDSRKVLYPRPDPDTKYFNNLALSFFLAKRGHVQGSLHKES